MAKTRRGAAGVVLLIVGIAAGDLLACGDKFLVPSRGMRFELTPAARQQAAVLLYLNSASSLSGTFARLSVDPALRKAGYRPTTVASAEELDRTLRQGSWDVVLLDLADGSHGGVAGAPGSPVVVAVAVNPTDSELATAKKQYAAVLKSPKRSQAFVDTLDVALTTRQAARARTAKATR